MLLFSSFFSSSPIFYSLERDAAYILAHFAQYSSLIYLLLNTKVLNPCTLHYCSCLFICSHLELLLYDYFNLLNITLSAPLLYMNILFTIYPLTYVYFYSITDILFLSLLNYIRCSSLYFMSYQLYLTTMVLSLSIYMNYHRQYLAMFMKASQSGEEALYFRFPSPSSSIITLWHILNPINISNNGSLALLEMFSCWMYFRKSGSWKSTFVISAGIYYLSPYPYTLLPIIMCLKDIQLHVSVPVLSENRC